MLRRRRRSGGVVLRRSKEELWERVREIVCGCVHQVRSVVLVSFF